MESFGLPFVDNIFFKKVRVTGFQRKKTFKLLMKQGKSSFSIKAKGGSVKEDMKAITRKSHATLNHFLFDDFAKKYEPMEIMPRARIAIPSTSFVVPVFLSALTTGVMRSMSASRFDPA